MAGLKNSPAVTVTVRPDGTYYVEKSKTQPKQTSITPVQRQPERTQLGGRPAPLAVAITTSLKDFAGIAVAVKAAAPVLGTYGALAAIGVGVLNAWAEAQPPRPTQRVLVLRRISRRTLK